MKISPEYFAIPSVTPSYPGLTKLELATFMAMQGLCANHDGVMTKDNRRSFHPDDISKVAVVIAQTTINELNKEA